MLFVDEQFMEKIRDEEIRVTAGVANISKKIREARLIWLGRGEKHWRSSSNKNV